MTARRAIARFALGGFAWGALALLLGAKAFGTSIATGVLASPVIGIAVGAMMQPRFDSAGRFRRKLVALASLYAGATLFGAVIGVGEWLGRDGRTRLYESLLEGLAAAWYGVTLFAIALWPLAYLTHWYFSPRALANPDVARG